jgi:hypothetical protein
MQDGFHQIGTGRAIWLSPNAFPLVRNVYLKENGVKECFAGVMPIPAAVLPYGGRSTDESTLARAPYHPHVSPPINASGNARTHALARGRRGPGDRG